MEIVSVLFNVERFVECRVDLLFAPQQKYRTLFSDLLPSPLHIKILRQRAFSKHAFTVQHCGIVQKAVTEHSVDEM